VKRIRITPELSPTSKVEIIESNSQPYCHEQLSTLEGSLVIFGFNFGEYDTHIIDAINKAYHYGKNLAINYIASILEFILMRT
jgi:hypothetical protein